MILRSGRIHKRCIEVVLDISVGIMCLLGRLKFHDDNENEKENDNETLLSFSLRFCTKRDERLVASISSSTTTIANRNPGRSQEMIMSAHKNPVLVLVVVLKS